MIKRLSLAALALLACLSQTEGQSPLINSTTGQPYKKGDTLKAQDLNTFALGKQDYPALNIGSLNSLTLGGPGVSGQLVQRGSTSGQVTQQSQPVAGSPVITWGNTTGTPAVVATAPLVINATTGNISCATCITTAGGQTIGGNLTVSGNLQGGTSPAAFPFAYRNAADGNSMMFSGATKGVRFAMTSTGTAIEGVDSTGIASYQPIFFSGLTHTFQSGASAAAAGSINSSQQWAMANSLTLGVNGTSGGTLNVNGASSGQRIITVNSTGTQLSFNGSPLTVPEGGTGDNGSAWTTFTPSFSCGSATFTNNGSKSKTMGKTTWVQFDFTITAIGTCTTQVNMNMPNNVNSSYMLTGQEVAVTGSMMGCKTTGAGTAGCVKNLVAAFAVNERFQVSGVYENQ